MVTGNQKKGVMKLWYLLLFIGLFGCDKDQTVPFCGDGNPKQINYLALGDSYTIGQSVCTTCRLVAKAITCAKGDKTNVIVVSIPDYAYTPFGQGAANISTGIDQYNAFAQNYCAENGIVFINITDITRLGLSQPELVASDGLHPSELAYSKFVERIVPSALTAIGN
jgi:hypothetical protein